MSIYPFRSTHQLGFTLVELMVTIIILAILLAIAVPWTSAWIDRAKVKNSANAVKSALVQARTAALRNPNGINDSSKAVSCVYLNGDNVEVRLLSSGGSCNTAPVIKSFSLSGTTIKQGGSAISSNCFSFNSNGMSNTSECADALSNAPITAEKNDEKATVDFV